MLTPIKQVEITTILDGRAGPTTTVEIQRQIGTKDKFVLYVNEEGQTIVRVTNLLKKQIKANGIIDVKLL